MDADDAWTAFRQTYPGLAAAAAAVLADLPPHHASRVRRLLQDAVAAAPADTADWLAAIAGHLPSTDAARLAALVRHIAATGCAGAACPHSLRDVPF